MVARSASLRDGNSTPVLLNKPQLRNRRRALKGKRRILKEEETAGCFLLVRPRRAGATFPHAAERESPRPAPANRRRNSSTPLSRHRKIAALSRQL